MSKIDDSRQAAKASVFLQRAQQAAAKGSFDFAIDMYIEGLRYAPDDLEAGHVRLRELSLLRQEKGGKKPSVIERVKQFQGKTALEQMLNAEYLLAKDPSHLPYIQTLIKAAAAGGYKKTTKWFADLLFQANNAAKKPSLRTYKLLKDTYAAISEYDRAVAACQHAVRLKPEDGNLADELQNLSAELTVARGKYDQKGDFRQSIKDRDKQEKLQAQEGVVKTEDYRISAVQQAREKLAKDPELPTNIFKLADALADLQQDKADNEAVELLENAYIRKSDFSFKQRAGLVRIKQLKRKIRHAKDALQANPNSVQARTVLSQLSPRLNSVELEHYALCVKNYPTDLDAKYQYGVRLLNNKQYDQAILLFQDAQKDPRRKITAMSKIGLCFLMKGWFADAIDVFNQAINAYEIKDNALAKELRYNLGRSYQRKGDTEKALDVFRKIAQFDFGYKDVRKRVDELRAAEDSRQSSTGGASGPACQ